MKDGDLSVIVVDDDETIARFLERAFKGAKSFASFNSAAGFLAGAELGRCDIVFMDINIPGGEDGIALTRRVRALAPQCDVVVMTGEATLDNAVAAIKAGAYDFLTKPFSFGILEAAVDRCVEKRAMSSELKLIKSAQEELSAAYSQLQGSERMKEAFLSVIGHELRTPMAKIIAGSDLLRGAAEAERGMLLDALSAGAAELHEVIESLILYAASSREPAPRNCKAVDLNELARSVGEELSPKAAAAGVALSVLRGPEALVEGEEELLRSAVRQLALNAIKFNKKGGSAEISVTAGASSAAVTVADSGIGIPPELLDGLGNPFYQVADYLTRKTGGLGLGLAVVKRIAEAHKGGISVTSAPGKGARFTVTFRKNAACG